MSFENERRKIEEVEKPSQTLPNIISVFHSKRYDRYDILKKKDLQNIFDPELGNDKFYLFGVKYHVCVLMIQNDVISHLVSFLWYVF